MKIVASEHSIRVVLTYGASITTKHNLDHAGDFLDLEVSLSQRNGKIAVLLASLKQGWVGIHVL